LKAVIAGGLIDRNLFSLFDEVEYRPIPISADLAILGIGLLRGGVQSDFCTLQVVTHEGRLRDDVEYVDSSGLRLVDILFNEKILPPEALAYKSDFIGFMERERARSYFRAGWYASSWRCYFRAARFDRRSLLDLRNVRRFFVSLAFDAAGLGSTPRTR